MASRERVLRLLEAAAHAIAESESLANRHRGEAYGLLDDTQRTRHQRGFH